MTYKGSLQMERLIVEAPQTKLLPVLKEIGDEFQAFVLTEIFDGDNGETDAFGDGLWATTTVSGHSDSSASFILLTQTSEHRTQNELIACQAGPRSP